VKINERKWHGVMKMAAKMKEMAAIMAAISKISANVAKINEEAGIIRRGVANGGVMSIKQSSAACLIIARINENESHKRQQKRRHAAKQRIAGSDENINGIEAAKKWNGNLA
jgi:hypothetical protein